MNRVYRSIAAGILATASMAVFAYCEDDYYKVTLNDRGTTAKTVKISAEAKSAGGFKTLLERDEADRAAVMQDQGMHAETKRKAIQFLDANIRNARCWKALVN